MTDDSRERIPGYRLKIVGLVPLALLILLFFGVAVDSLLVGTDLAFTVFAIVLCAVFLGLALLGRSEPIAGGIVLLLGVAPIGYFFAAISFYSDSDSRRYIVAAAFTVFFGLPLLSGLALLASGIVKLRASRGGRVS